MSKYQVLRIVIAAISLNIGAESEPERVVSIVLVIVGGFLFALGDNKK